MAAVLLLVGTLVPAASAEVTKIGTGFDPAICKDAVVWYDADGAISYYDIADGSRSIIAEANGSYPHAYGSRVVWMDDSSQDLRMGVYDLDLMQISYVCGEFDEFSRPRISGKNAVWGAGGEIYLCDVEARESRAIAKGYDPDVSGDRIAYVAREERGAVIRVYDANDGTVLTIPYMGDVYSPRIDGWRVVFATAYDGSSDLYSYDLSREQLAQVARCDIVSVSSERPDYRGLLDESEIRGNRIAYVKSVSDDFGDAGIWIYDAAIGGKSMPVGLRGIVELSIDISEDAIVWGYECPPGDRTGDCPIYALAG